MHNHTLTPEILEKIAEAVQEIRIMNTMNVVTTTILIVDYIQTFSLEVDLIWAARWTFGKVVFLLLRYITFATVPIYLSFTMLPLNSEDLCGLFWGGTLTMVYLSMALAEVCLVHRTYAIWNCSKKVLYSLSSLLAGLSGASFVVIVLFLRSLHFRRSPMGSGCYMEEDAQMLLFFNFMATILFELVILLCTVYHGIKYSRGPKNKLAAVVYRDGTLFPVIIFLVSAANLVLLPLKVHDPLVYFQLIIHTTLAARMMLHLREAMKARELENDDDLEKHLLKLQSTEDGLLS